jgi:hypothetical protein
MQSHMAIEKKKHLCIYLFRRNLFSNLNLQPIFPNFRMDIKDYVKTFSSSLIFSLFLTSKDNDFVCCSFSFLSEGNGVGRGGSLDGPN